LARLGAAWIPHKDKFHRVHYRASAELQDDGSVLTTHDFLDGIGKSLTIDNNEALVRLLITMNPVFRLRDARTARDGIERLPWGICASSGWTSWPASSPMSPSASASQNSRRRCRRCSS
jgi:putative ATP-dependent endonuclease of OLD family